MRADGIAFFASSLPEGFRGFCSVAGPPADFCSTALSRVPSKEATANAAPHTSARAAVTVFNPLPTSPRRTPQTTDKLTNVTPAVTHFMELWLVAEKLRVTERLRVTEKVRVSVRCHQSPALCLGTRL